jgi:hypothetical protein
MNMPYLRYVAFSYSDTITTRDNNKMVRLVSSPSYRQLWGDRFVTTKTGERKIENNMTGFKLATSVGGVGTGERGDRVILDDPHNVIQAESALEREKTVRFFRESMSNRATMLAPALSGPLATAGTRRFANFSGISSFSRRKARSLAFGPF